MTKLGMSFPINVTVWVYADSYEEADKELEQILIVTNEVAMFEVHEDE